MLPNRDNNNIITAPRVLGRDNSIYAVWYATFVFNLLNSWCDAFIKVNKSPHNLKAICTGKLINISISVLKDERGVTLGSWNTANQKVSNKMIEMDFCSDL